MKPTKKRNAKEYLIDDNKTPYANWIKGLKDPKAKAKIVTAVRKMENGNAGKSESVGKGVSEYKIDYGPGYRIYYGQDGKELIILLCGGDKNTQSIDITKAQEYWADYKKKKPKKKQK